MVVMVMMVMLDYGHASRWTLTLRLVQATGLTDMLDIFGYDMISMMPSSWLKSCRAHCRAVPVAPWRRYGCDYAAFDSHDWHRPYVKDGGGSGNRPTAAQRKR